ncbi:hypothetical protein PAEVO_66780 [Paenibacillus sp. GM2FR]|nr:hypothetical protein PAEVO_66780 [Paenibacillus sp. GM2FR]
MSAMATLLLRGLARAGEQPQRKRFHNFSLLMRHRHVSISGPGDESEGIPVVQRPLKLDKIGVDCSDQTHVYVTTQFIDLNRDAMLHMVLKMAVVR